MTKKIKLSNSESNKVHHHNHHNHHNHSHNHGEMCHGHGIIGIVDGVTGENIIQVNGENLRSVPNGHSLIHSINNIINSHSKHGIIKNILKDSTIITGTLSSKSERINTDKQDKQDKQDRQSSSLKDSKHNEDTNKQHQQQQQQQQYQTTQQQQDMIFRNKLNNSLSRNIPPLSLLKENFKDEMENSFHTAISNIKDLNEKVEMVNLIFQHSLADNNAMANVDSIIHSSTSGLLSQYQQITEKFDWEQSSKGYKNKGNELFQKRQYSDALLLYNEALRLYNIEDVDIEDNSTTDVSKMDTSILSSIHSNRCLCLVNLERYKEGAIEATRGIELVNSSAHLLHKLYYRRGICYYHLRKHYKAKKDFLRAHRLIEKRDSSDIASIENYLSKIQKLSLPIHKDEENEKQLDEKQDNEQQLPQSEITTTIDEILKNSNSLIDSRVSFKFQSDSVGRVSEASDFIPSNTVLYQEQPYVSCLDRNYHSQYCYNCFKEILSPIYCKGCNNSQYCSSKCLNEDFVKQHSRECGKGFLNICSHESLLVIRILARKGRDFREKNKNKSAQQQQQQQQKRETNLNFIPNPCEIGIDQNISTKTTTTKTTTTQTCNNNISELQNLQISQDDELYDIPNDPALFGKTNSYTQSYDLINSFDPHYNHHSNENIANMIFDAFVIERFLLYYQKELGILKEDIDVNVILRHLCQLTTYTFSIPGYIDHQDNLNLSTNSSGSTSSSSLRTSMESSLKYNVQKYTQDKIGYAVFPLASLMNHSCDNNTHLQYDGCSLKIKSLFNIESGDEILGCYGPHAFLHPLKDRLISLYKEYFFICRCKACSEKRGPDPLKCTGTADDIILWECKSMNNSKNGGGGGNEQRPPFCTGTLLESINMVNVISSAKLQQQQYQQQLVDKKKDHGLLRSHPLSSKAMYERYDDYENRLFVCNKCGIELCGMECYVLTSQIIISDNLFEMGSKAVLEGNLSKETESMLLKSLEIRKTVFKPCSKKIGDIYDALSRYSIGRENGNAAAIYSEKLIDNILQRLGHSNSGDLGREYSKLASIYLSLGEFSKSEQCITKAENILLCWSDQPGDEEVLFLLINHKKLFAAAQNFPIR